MRSVGHPGLSDSKKLEFIEASTEPCAEQRKWQERNRLYMEDHMIMMNKQLHGF